MNGISFSLYNTALFLYKVWETYQEFVSCFKIQVNIMALLLFK